MALEWMNLFAVALQFLMTLGTATLAVLLFWHLRRIRKPVLAFIFWVVILLTALTPLFNVIQSGLPFSSLPLWWAVGIILVPLLIAGAYFVNPLKPKHYSFEDDELDTENHTIH